MGYAEQTGYVPLTVEEIIEAIMDGINTEFGTTFTTESFVGTGFYKYLYVTAQRIQRNEIKTSEIFLKLQDYFKTTNERILNPKVTPNGLLDVFNEAGYVASVKPMDSSIAGELYVAVVVDETDPNYAEKRLEICTIIKNFTVAGVVTQGTEEEALTLSNGQLFTFKFNLPDRTAVKLRLTITLSRNNQGVIGSPEDLKAKLLQNIAARYSLGMDFEPKRYFTPVDAPWAGDILLEYSLDDGDNWDDETYASEYDELFTFDLADVLIVEN